jgi:hypothetical protein
VRKGSEALGGKGGGGRARRRQGQRGLSAIEQAMAGA